MRDIRFKTFLKPTGGNLKYYYFTAVDVTIFAGKNLPDPGK